MAGRIAERRMDYRPAGRWKNVRRLGLVVVGLLAAGVVTGCSPAQVAEAPAVVEVRTVIENDTVFGGAINFIFVAAGDVTNDGRPDLVFTRDGGPEAGGAHVAVFQAGDRGWDAGRPLEGPSTGVAARPIIAPIRNDGQNWLVYSEHKGGGQGRALRAHRYDGQLLVEHLDIAERAGLPGRQAATAADLDGDGRLEIWYVELYGDPGAPTTHLLRRQWDAAGGGFPGGEIAGGGTAMIIVRPQMGDFLADGRPGLVWLSRAGRLELLTYNRGTEGAGYASRPIYDSQATLVDFHVGEYDGRPGTDIAVATMDNELAGLQLISGGTLVAQELAGDLGELLSVVRLADLNGDGLAEIYLAGRDGGIYGFDAVNGWRTLAAHPGVFWQDGAILDGNGRPQLIFVGRVNGATFRVVSLSIAD
jgi:hypothetical protein